MKKIVSLVLFCFLTAGFVPAASAHERRVVAGQFEFIVGFINEPAFSGQMNGVDLRVTQKNKPVENLEGQLKVIVLRSDVDKTLELAFSKKYNDPGHYAAHFLPAKPGKYIFRITGTINGAAIDEQFESGEKFHDVNDVVPLQFP
ncbi:MAG: hypothetical protein IT395_07955 [Candidatus Omnitrophica bacterium]|nr:hypothetical protein [Candidatus Omnitrophota bacterium]